MQYPILQEQKKQNLDSLSALLENALQQKPNAMTFLANLVEVKFAQEKFEEGEVYIRKILEHEDCTTDKLFFLSRTYFKVFMDEKALDCILRVASNESTNKEVLCLRAKILYRLNKKEEALLLINQIMEQHSYHEKSLLFLANHHFLNNHFAESIKHCEAILTITPNNCKAIRHLIQAKYHMGKLDEHVTIANYSLITKKINVSSGLSPKLTIEDFNQQLIENINNTPEWIINPQRYTVNKGRQLSLNLLKDPVLLQLKSVISKSVSEYLQHVSTLKLPYFNANSKELSLDIWAVGLSKGGYHDPHIHASAWISGVYYAQVPQREATNKEGFLEFGVNCPSNQFQALHAIQPTEGLLVLFPSYLVHRTVPTHSDEERICFAFDVTPVAALNPQS